VTALTVSTWSHNRKGLITGIEVGKDTGTNSEWMHVVIVGDQTVRQMSNGGVPAHIFDGEPETYRRSLMTLVSAADVEVSPEVEAMLATNPFGAPA
jgi:hypothetical protein